MGAKVVRIDVRIQTSIRTTMVEAAHG